jgi:hypothetical protein
MPLITRQEKGSKLTIQEMDGNLEYLESNGFINGEYNQTQIGTGAVIDLSYISYDPAPLTDTIPNIYTVNPTGGDGSGLELSLRVVDDRGSKQFDFANSTIINGGLGYSEGNEVTFSSNDIGGTLNETITLVLLPGTVDVTVLSSIAVSTDSITLRTAALLIDANVNISANVEVGGTIDATGIRSQNINGDASLDSLRVFNPTGITTVSFPNLPVTDPGIEGYLWVDAANDFVLKVSQG